MRDYHSLDWSMTGMKEHDWEYVLGKSTEDALDHYLSCESDKMLMEEIIKTIH